MQEKEKRKRAAAEAAGGPRPRPDPRHPEAVLDTVPRAAGIDVHKMSLTCTLLVEGAGGRVASDTRQYRTYGEELRQLVGWLAAERPARVVMESTGVFWKPVQRALDAAGIEVWIVNARHVKRVPGRKTDVSDSQWLAALARYGLVTPSFVAPPELEELRRLTRLHARTRQVASKVRNMLHRLLDESGLRIGGILTDLFGASGRALLAGLIEGLEEERMLRGVQGRARGKIPALREALEGGLADEVRPVAALMLRTLDGIERTLADLEGRILETAERDWEVPWTLLQTLPGAGPLAAAALLAETGADMGQFGTARRLASWAGMCPGNRESAGKAQGGRRRKGNAYLRRILTEIAHAASRTKGAQFGPRKRAVALRRGTGRAVVAPGHRILRIAFAMLRDCRPYEDPEVDCEADTARRNLARWMRMIEKAKLMPEVAQAAAESMRRSLEAARSATPAGGLPGAAAAATA